MNEGYAWAQEMNCAVTVCDKDGKELFRKVHRRINFSTYTLPASDFLTAEELALLEKVAGIIRENTAIADAMNLGSMISTRDLCANDIVRYVRAMQNQTGAAVSVHTIADGQAEAVEFLVDENTENCGIPLKNLKPKANVLIASITHGSVTEIPNGDSMFHKGDSVVVVTTGRGVLKQLNDIFIN